MHLVRYREAQEELMETPDSLPSDFAPDAATARAPRRRRRRRRAALARSARSRTHCCAAYAIPVAPGHAGRRRRTRPATAARPILAAGRHGRGQDPVAGHRAQVRRRRRRARPHERAPRVHAAAADIFARAARLQAGRPHHGRHGAADGAATEGARTDRRPRRRSDLRAGDRVRHAAAPRSRSINDKALALPPLDLEARRTTSSRAPASSRLLEAPIATCPPPTSSAVALVLVKLAQLAADLPGGARARHQSAPRRQGRRHRGRCPRRRRAGRRKERPRRAIRASRSGPIRRSGNASSCCATAGEVFVRPVRPEDEELFLALLQARDAEDLRLRFFAPGARFQPRLPRAPDADRLRPRHRLRRDRSRERAR